VVVVDSHRLQLGVGNGGEEKKDGRNNQPGFHASNCTKKRDGTAVMYEAEPTSRERVD
jgi:hypothetical protein